ncbi:GD17725 [Drosophila simulans]|uniref:GD17725 n=1 Tax=Drosophila simulans TaxID=7240 RepID=B4NSV7_DROSI|nr:GD17725 [Drosophila simulans]
MTILEQLKLQCGGTITGCGMSWLYNSQNLLDDPMELIDSIVASTKTELVLRGNPMGFHNPYNPDSNQSLKHLRN